MERLCPRVIAKNKNKEPIFNEASWYIRGIFYHLSRLHNAYYRFAHGISGRVGATNANVCVIFEPVMAETMFEFYSLVTLSKISLDRLRILLNPFFDNPLPKSISEIKKSKNNCPIYRWITIENRELLDYLIDVRDFISHYTGFAVSNNAVISEEQVSLEDLAIPLCSPMLKAAYRKMGDKGICVNIYLPDKIFEDEKGKICNFSYDKGFNLLSTSQRFFRLSYMATSQSFKLWLADTPPQFTYKK